MDLLMGVAIQTTPVHDTEQMPRVPSVLVPSPRLWAGLRVGQWCLSPVLPSLCFSQEFWVVARIERPRSHRATGRPAGDLSRVRKRVRRAFTQKKQSSSPLS